MYPLQMFPQVVLALERFTMMAFARGDWAHKSMGTMSLLMAFQVASIGKSFEIAAYGGASVRSFMLVHMLPSQCR